MRWPSLTVILSAVTAAYVAHSVWTIASLFYPATCPPKGKCITSFLNSRPRLQLKVFTTTKEKPRSEKDLTLVWSSEDLNMSLPVEKLVNVSIPRQTRNNGSLFALIALLGPGQALFTSDVHSTTVSIITKLTTYSILKAEAFNLIGGTSNETEELHTTSTERPTEPVTHWRSHIRINVMDELIAFETKNVPGDLYRFLRVTEKREYLPMLYIDELNYRIRDLLPVNETSLTLPLTIKYEPISIGKLRMWSNMQEAFKTLHGLGFSEKDTDEVKGIFADTNFYLLILTFVVSAVHLLFDFLAFRNDISFWKNRRDMVGVSSRTVVWRCVSTCVIFLYLWDENTSMLVLIPAGIGTIIEAWKVKKAFKVKVTWAVWKPKFELGAVSGKEKETQEFDSQAMKYLSFVLWPLIVCGAVYSLIYTPHKSWYSWCIQTLVNGIYAFGFLFMLPQLFLNYKLKSVAHLPWKAFMYKAFNTFIDDIFAFIITMPTAHRLACFRDDIVFVIYLYQRWLYPIDKTRVNEYGQSFEDDAQDTAQEQKISQTDNHKKIESKKVR